MKKYTNTSNAMVCVEFKGSAQFLRRGQSVTNDLETIRVPEGVLVEEVGSKSKVTSSKNKKTS